MKTLITGFGIWSCIGTDPAEVSDAMLHSRCGIIYDAERKAAGYQSALIGNVPSAHGAIADLRRSQRICMSEPSEYAYCAVRQALTMAHLENVYGMALICSNDSTAGASHHANAVMQEKHDTRYLGAGTVFQSLNSTVSMTLASVFGFDSLSLTVSAACAGGGHAVGMAHALIQAGVIKRAVVVGAQEVGLHAYESFDALGVFSKNTEPRSACRPFDKSRTGLVPSGGAACVVLESEDAFRDRLRYLRERNTDTLPVSLGSITGYGFSTSENIVTPSSVSILRSMHAALQNSGRSIGEMDMVVAHATGTHDGDAAEATAIADCMSLEYWRDIDDRPWVVSTKALTGHECWMSGVSQLVYTLLMMRAGFVAGNPNLLVPCCEAEALRMTKTSVILSRPHRRALLNAFGFGGTNSTVILETTDI